MARDLRKVTTRLRRARILLEALQRIEADVILVLIDTQLPLSEKKQKVLALLHRALEEVYDEAHAHEATLLSAIDTLEVQVKRLKRQLHGFLKRRSEER